MYEFIKKYDGRYIMGGDFNAKHTHWGSRLTTTKVENFSKLYKQLDAILLLQVDPLIIDRRKLPDLLDFFIINKLPKINLSIKDSSDHSPVLLTLYKTNNFMTTLCNKHTNWFKFKRIPNKVD